MVAVTQREQVASVMLDLLILTVIAVLLFTMAQIVSPVIALRLVPLDALQIWHAFVGATFQELSVRIVHRAGSPQDNVIRHAMPQPIAMGTVGVKSQILGAASAVLVGKGLTATVARSITLVMTVSGAILSNIASTEERATL
eukprot:gnl/MRDRNA2_/MRDRNA2_185263_c0_seq1.p2 gnl/MRDRNA2_/MRDRNA2_185263_c0~~gnl/MRDRNA2_/MRDRNA2_185263_c0_seq1.p2  ORF type:complete len:142 (+),score=24.99 gnl/MRDRNA2_/MRDRNA2_185263_c0_seq1:255-680(+)